MGDLPIFVTAVATFAMIGVGIGMLVARRLDRWVAAKDEQHDQPDQPDQPEEHGADARPDA